MKKERKDKETFCYHIINYLGTDRVEDQWVHSGHIEVKDGEVKSMKSSNQL